MCIQPVSQGLQPGNAGWMLIYERMQGLGRLERLETYKEPKNNARRSNPRTLKVSPVEAAFKSQTGEITISNQD